MRQGEFDAVQAMAVLVRRQNALEVAKSGDSDESGVTTEVRYAV